MKYVLLIGDQIYADAPRASSLLRADHKPPLLEATVAEIRARDQLLDVLWAHQRTNPNQTLVLLSGDMHQGTAVAWRWPDGAYAYQ